MAKRLKDPRYLAKVAQLPCVICTVHRLPQLSQTQVHHVIHDRFSFHRSGDDRTIPLCEGHHQGLFDTSKIALHKEPKLWREFYGDDHSHLEWVRGRMGKGDQR
jgi:hypothetical protein